MFKRVAIASTIALAAMLIPATWAGGQIGASLINTDAELDTGLEQFEADDAGWKVFAGYSILGSLGVEASYRDLGNLSDSGANGGVDFDVEVFDVSVRGILPIVRVLNLFGRVGYANISTEGTVDVQGVLSDFDEDDWELFYGFGVDVNLTSRFGLRAEWEEYDTDDSLDSISLGGFYRW